jgi:hypothetical protein
VLIQLEIPTISKTDTYDSIKLIRLHNDGIDKHKRKESHRFSPKDGLKLEICFTCKHEKEGNC